MKEHMMMRIVGKGIILAASIVLGFFTAMISPSDRGDR